MTRLNTEWNNEYFNRDQQKYQNTKDHPMIWSYELAVNNCSKFEYNLVSKHCVVPKCNEIKDDYTEYVSKDYYYHFNQYK